MCDSVACFGAASDDESDCFVAKILKSAFYHTKNILSPGAKNNEDRNSNSTLKFSEAPHPGADGVSFEEAIEKCPHLAAQYKQQGPESSINGTNETPTSNEVSRCPYQNPAAQEWPMRAVLLFVAYNFISAGVSIEFIKIVFVACAYHIGMLHLSEFLVLYLATARMSSYKLLGLLLMITNKGGPVVSAKQYRVTPLHVFYGCMIALGSLVMTGMSMYWAVYMEYFKGENQSDSIEFSPMQHLFIPIASEFVFRGFLQNEMKKDLGAWFGIIGSSGWYGILQKGQISVKFAGFVQGCLWCFCSMAFKGNLIPTTIANVLLASLKALHPDLYFAFYPIPL